MFTPANQAPSRSFLFSVALISAAILGFEVALTRLFSVLLRYHYAFLVISVALCGMGLGGFAAQWLKRRDYKISLLYTALSFSVTSVLAVLLMLRVVFAFFPQAYWLSAVLVLIPFLLAGIFLAEAFARYPHSGGRLYAWDLAGAAVAAAGIVVLLQFAGAINACIIVAALSALAGVLAHTPAERSAPDAPGEGQAPQDGESVKAVKKSGTTEMVLSFVPVLFVVLAMINTKLPLFDIPAIPPATDSKGASVSDRGLTQPLFTELGGENPPSRIIETRWNAFARTDVVEDKTLPGAYYVYTNGNVPTIMTRWDGNPYALPRICADYPLIDWIFANAPLGERTPTEAFKEGGKAAGSVLSIGPGGGLDAMMALRWGAANFDGAEINPSIVQIMDDYRSYNGGIYDDPRVHVETADGRAAVQDAIRAGKRYALIYSALTKTATAAQGAALLESFIYTEDAFSDYWDALTPNGQMAIVTDQPVLLARLFTTSVAMLQKRGISAQEACKHVVLAEAPGMAPYSLALIVSKAPYTEKQTFELSDSTSPRSLNGIFIPGRTGTNNYGPYPDVASGKMDLNGFIAWWRNNPMFKDNPLDMTPCPDNRPFVLDLTIGLPPSFVQLGILTLVLGLGLAAMSWSEFRAPAQGRIAERDADASEAVAEELGVELPAVEGNGFPLVKRLLFMGYFTCLGVGFMMVEIPLAQKIILPLGYPTLALTTILFSVLLGGGAGSWFSQRFAGSRLRSWAVAAALAVCVVTVISAFSLSRADDFLLGFPIATRCILTGLALLPFGFLLGTPFPSGIRLFAEGEPHHIPILWGLNGVASVVGSLAAATGAKVYGFNTVLIGGATIYLFAAVLLFFATTPTKLSTSES